MFKIEFRGKNIEITDAMKERAENACEKLHKYFKDDSDVLLKYELEFHKAESSITVEISSNNLNHFIKNTEKGDDIYLLIDRVTHKLLPQIEKNK